MGQESYVSKITICRKALAVLDLKRKNKKHTVILYGTVTQKY